MRKSEPSCTPPTTYLNRVAWTPTRAARAMVRTLWMNFCGRARKWACVRVGDLTVEVVLREALPAAGGDGGQKHRGSSTAGSPLIRLSGSGFPLPSRPCQLASRDLRPASQGWLSAPWRGATNGRGGNCCGPDDFGGRWCPTSGSVKCTRRTCRGQSGHTTSSEKASRYGWGN